MINKLIKLLLTFLICLTCFNLVNYLMLLNTDFYQYFLFKITTSNSSNIVDMFSINWYLSYYINYVILGLSIIIFVLKIIDLKGVK